MYELNHKQQTQLSTVLMEYLNGNDWKELFKQTDCEEFPQQNPNFYEDLSWEEEKIEQNCADALDFILSKDSTNLKVIWEVPGVQTMTNRKDLALEAEIQALIASSANADSPLTEMFTHFESERFQVRPIRMDDADFIFETWAQDLEITKYMTWKPHQSIEETRSYIASCINDWENNSYTWIIEDKESKNIIGSFAARRNAYKLDVGYLLIKETWGNSYMSEVLKAFVEEAFNIEGIIRIGAVCDLENLASKRVMEKAGMSFEGVLKKWTIHPNIEDTPRDCFCLSIVKSAKPRQCRSIATTTR